MKNIIIFLCNEKENQRERLGYSRAFIHLGYKITYCGDSKNLKRILSTYESDIFCVIHPEPYTSTHSIDLWEFNIPNAIIQWDTFTIKKTRVQASIPYDMQIICHPDYVDYYRSFGCPHVLLLPWCIDDLLLENVMEGRSFERKFDVGWVGRSDAKFYSNRRQALQLIKDKYFLNDFNRYYSWQEMFEIFLQSKIVINVSRDDYPCDANMRCFEAMGCGALLITQLPSELEKLGFRDKEHFVGFSNMDMLIEIVDYYLKTDNERERIAANGRNLVLSRHTYEVRASEIISYINTNGEKILRENNFRKLNIANRYYYLAYSYYKEGNLKELWECLLYAPLRKKGMLFCKYIILKLKFIKKDFLK